MSPVSLYVHVPFCSAKCGYCDFVSVAGVAERRCSHIDPVSHQIASRLPSEATMAQAYVESVVWWLETYQSLDSSAILDDVATLYIGGGTPTILGPEAVRLVSGIRERVKLRPFAEVTIEANPESVDAALATQLIDAGVTRFSLGVQSLDDDVLRTLGRRHDSGQAVRAAALLADTEAALAVDAMCGIPGQSMESWESTLRGLIDTGANHVSVYPLTIEDGTPMAAAIHRSERAEPDSDMAAEMMLRAEDILSASGLHRYEVASYARPGFESVHNTGYWTGMPYLGIGPSAASMLSGEALAASPLTAAADCARVRFVLHATLESFLAHPWVPFVPSAECLSAEEVGREDVMLGMRLTEGVPHSAVVDAGLADAMLGLERVGLVERVGSVERVAEQTHTRWRTTRSGWLLGNEVFSRLWSPE